MIDRQAEHEAMIRRVEQAQKAISPSATNRGRLAGMSWALTNVLDELYERMTLAWRALNDVRFDHPKHHTYRAQKAAELSLCYAGISKVYDELCRLRVISKNEQTEKTVYELAKEAEATERAALRAEKKIRIVVIGDDGKAARVRVPVSQYERSKR